MFAELCTEAGPLTDYPRVEARATNKAHEYNFVWTIHREIDPKTLIYVRYYVAREGGACASMSKTIKWPKTTRTLRKGETLTVIVELKYNQIYQGEKNDS